MDEGLRDLFEEAVMGKINISKKTLVGMRTTLGYRNSTISGIDYNMMWEMWLSGHMAAWREVDKLIKCRRNNEEQ